MNTIEEIEYVITQLIGSVYGENASKANATITFGAINPEDETEYELFLEFRPVKTAAPKKPKSKKTKGKKK